MGYYVLSVIPTEVDGIQFWGVKSSKCGNPRYMFARHHLFDGFAESHEKWKEETKKAMTHIGARPAKKEDLGYCVIESYSLKETARRIKEAAYHVPSI